MVPHRIHTMRLELSVPEDGDEQAIFEACQDPQIARFVPVPNPYERKHAAGFIKYAAAGWESGREMTWAIRSEVGLIGMTSLRVNDDEAEIGYWLSADARGRGHAAEAVGAALDFGCSPEGLGLVRVEWRAAVGNTASARVGQRLGFSFEGTLRHGIRLSSGRQDCWVAGLLATDERVPTSWPID